MVLADFADYRRMQQYAVSVWADKKKWQQMSLMNISGAGIFSADRAIHEYADNIWHTKSAFNGETYQVAEPAKVKKRQPNKSQRKKLQRRKPLKKKPKKSRQKKSRQKKRQPQKQPLPQAKKLRKRKNKIAAA